MPELPEVESAARDLHAQLAGHRLGSITHLSWPKVLEGGPEAFRQGLEGQRLLSVGRRAKWILAQLDNGLVWALHLRMSGAAIVRPANAPPPDAHTHLAIAIDDGRSLHWRDVRKFGRMRLLDPAGLAALDAAHGVEPLSADFTPTRFAQLLQGKRTQLKPFLLDQKHIAGLGNIYVDEALWFAQLHPTRPAGSLQPTEVAALHAAIQGVLTRAIDHGGSTFRDYRNGYGEVGGHQDHFRAYGQSGKPCQRCQAPIQRSVLGQRGTHVCPVCQPRPQGQA